MELKVFEKRVHSTASKNVLTQENGAAFDNVPAQ